MYQWIYITVHLYSNNVSKWATYPACFGIIYKHIHNNVCPFVLPKMTPFCTKITIIFLGADPQSPLQSWLFYILLCYICIHIKYILIIKQNSIIQPLNLQIHYLQRKKNRMKNPVLPPFWTNQHSDPPPPPFGFFFLLLCFSKFFGGWK